MIDNNYNQKFRKFFDKFYIQYLGIKNKEEKDFLWNLAVNYIKKNRDFVMQYPIVQYWNEINKEKHIELEEEFLNKYKNKEVNLYFHIPFCKTRCTYCNFHIVVGDNKKNLLEKFI